MKWLATASFSLLVSSVWILFQDLLLEGQSLDTLNEMDVVFFILGIVFTGVFGGLYVNQRRP